MVNNIKSEPAQQRSSKPIIQIPSQKSGIHNKTILEIHINPNLRFTLASKTFLEKDIELKIVNKLMYRCKLKEVMCEL